MSYILQKYVIVAGKTVGFEVGQSSPPVGLTGELTEGNKFQLKQFHLHFGCEKEKGSEHTIDGERYHGEVRSLHSNSNPILR